MSCLAILLLLPLAGAMATGLQAQQIAPHPETAQTQSQASLTGTVRDTAGSTVPGVHVTLLGQGNSVNRMTTADAQGAFTFANVPPGTYRVTLDSAGVEPFTSGDVVLAAGEKQALPLQAVRMPVQTTTVNVEASVEQVAEAQVKEQEQQRIFGLLPDYYTSYIWNAAPMTPKLKFGMARRTLTDPTSFLVVAGIAGAEQWRKTFPGYGQGAEGYAKRFGSTYADTVASRMFGSAIYPTLFHQDPRYYYHGTGSVASRLIYAIKYTFICRADDGHLEPNYSHVLGSFTAAGISNLYKSPQDRQASLTFRNGLIITASGVVVNVLREFLSRQLTPTIPAFANGKP